MSSFDDRFAFAAGAYATYRPRYPAALFDWLRRRLPDARRVWDCGTGNGQAASSLAERFELVVATDASLAQLAHADHANTPRYVAMTAEACALRIHSLDLVTVAQALHWFHRGAFFDEVRRVLAPGGLIAIWSYGIPTVGPAIDDVLRHFHDVEVGPFWSPARRLVESGYRGVELPFIEEPTPLFEMEASWTLAQLGGYLSTWSAVGKYRAMNARDPVPQVMHALGERWGGLESVRPVRWPLTLRVGSSR